MPRYELSAADPTEVRQLWRRGFLADELRFIRASTQSPELRRFLDEVFSLTRASPLAQGAPLGELKAISAALDEFFDIAGSGTDPAFSRFLPAAYEADGREWRSWTDPAFSERFNGLMLRGDNQVSRVFLAAFPSDGVLEAVIARGTAGDLLFVHHPIDLESGDPHGRWGRFFRPIPENLVRELKDRRLSIYSCHAPLDYHVEVSTSRAISSALGGHVTGEFFPYGQGHAGVIARIPVTSPENLEATLRRIFDVPYLDVAGSRPPRIEKVAIVAGAGDRIEHMAEAEAAGAQAYITGEIHSRIDTEYGHSKFEAVERFAETSAMALLGVSHAASEFLVMKRDMRAWFSNRFAVETVLLPEQQWWR